MCNSIFIGCFCVVFHCNTYELYGPFSIQIVVHIGLFVKTGRIVAGGLQSLEIIMHAWSVSASSQSALFKSKIFSYCMVVLE